MPGETSTQEQDQRRQEQANNDDDAFAQHREQDSALGNQEHGDAQRQGMSFVARTLIYVGIPLFAGIAGLYVGYLRTLENAESKVDFDTDFVVPFLLALALVAVISVQTKGFTKRHITPLVQWPSVRRKKKIIRKRIIVDDDGNEIKEEGKMD